MDLDCEILNPSSMSISPLLDEGVDRFIPSRSSRLHSSSRSGGAHWRSCASPSARCSLSSLSSSSPSSFASPGARRQYRDDSSHFSLGAGGGSSSTFTILNRSRVASSVPSGPAATEGAASFPTSSSSSSASSSSSSSSSSSLACPPHQFDGRGLYHHLLDSELLGLHGHHHHPSSENGSRSSRRSPLSHSSSPLPSGASRGFVDRVDRGSRFSRSGCSSFSVVGGGGDPSLYSTPLLLGKKKWGRNSSVTFNRGLRNSSRLFCREKGGGGGGGGGAKLRGRVIK